MDDGFAVLERDDARLHLWQAAGTASCRIETEDIDGLYAELTSADVLHPVSRDGVSETDFDTREFAALDADGNLIEFFRWVG